MFGKKEAKNSVWWLYHTPSVDYKAEENMSTLMMSEKAPKRPAKRQTGSSKRRQTLSEHIGKIMRGREKKRTK
jgi:hypothetical protein